MLGEGKSTCINFICGYFGVIPKAKKHQYGDALKNGKKQND